MKAVLMSIQPKWCELIANGKKTVEVRKTRPKLETPFKVYIYETKGKTEIPTFIDEEGHEIYQGRGQVVGEFVCDEIYNIAPKTPSKYDCGWNVYEDHSRLTFRELRDYLGNGKCGYGWHISDLVIYDKPKELSEFVVEGDCSCENCGKCKWFDRGNGYNVEDDCLLPYTNSFGKAIKPLFRPPQSWCYVEGSDNNGE